MTKELQSSRYIVISFLVREMGIDIVEAISLMAELEKSGLVRLESSGDLILKFLFSGGKMTKELQSSRYIVISFLVHEMGIDIVEAISLMAELEKSGLVRLESSGDLILKELGGAL